MAKASDNQFPKVIFVEQGSTPTTPSAGNQIIFIRNSDNKVCRVNSSGTVTLIEGGTITVQEVDTSPSVAATQIIFPNGTLTDNGGGSVTYTPAAAGTAISDWYKMIAPAASIPSAKVGTWTVSYFTDVTYLLASPHAVAGGASQNDAISWVVPLSAGTWTIDLHVRESTNTGIATLNIDGSSVGTLDTYHALQYAKLTLTGVTVATSALHTFQILMATKNASSSGYYMNLFAVEFTRTA